jgi:hypothetical protein
MNMVMQKIEKFSEDPTVKSLESFVFFLIIAVGVFLLHRWFSKKEPEEIEETIEENIKK